MTSNKFIIGTFTYGICLILPVLTNTIKSPEIVNRQMKELEDKLTLILHGLNKKNSIPIYGNTISLEKIDAETRMIQDNQEETDPLLRNIHQFLKSRKLQIRFPSDGSSADYFGRVLGEKNFNFELKDLTNGSSERKRFYNTSYFVH
jgi:hypothetical protein